MPLSLTRPLSEEPTVQLSAWRVMQTDIGSTHFVGRNDANGNGRVSSDIVEFDAISQRGVTRSGRVYHLIGPSGVNLNAEYVWHRWCAFNGIRSYKDVTKTMLEDADDSI
jgi:hypothetical protein